MCAIVGGPAFGSQGILNGTACSSATSPVVLVNLRDSGGSPSGSCTGTVIAPRAVLTAAHCLVGDTASVRVYLGSGDPVAAVSFTPSPDYHGSDSASLDVGVILTGQDMDRSPVPLLSSRDAVVGETAIVVGWGKDQNGNGTTLRAGSTTITTVGANYLETPSTAGNSGVCSGDSGGPILLSEGGVWSVAGVTSAGATGGSCTIGPYYFANIRNSRILAFILSLVPNAIRQ